MAVSDTKLSMVDGTAFASNPVSDLGGAVGSQVTVTDGSGNKAVGCIKSKGVTRTLSAELLLNPNFDNWTGAPLNDQPDNWTVSETPPGSYVTESVGGGEARIFSDGTAINIKQAVLVSGGLYELEYQTTASVSGAVTLEMGAASISRNVAGVVPSATWVVTSGGVNFTAKRLSAVDITFDHMRLKQVLTPSTNGFVIEDGPGSGVENWASVDVGFDPEDIVGVEIKVPATFAVRSALQSKLDSIYPALATAWENVEYVPVVDTPYQAAYVLTAEPDNPTMGDDYYREQGIFQVSLFYPLSVGTSAAEVRAELIRTTFKRGTSMTSGSVTVIVNKTPEISQGRRDGDRWMIPVKIRWYAGIF
ncbi:DUF4128 domain-containing protein [Candidatus Pacearchaeota archaeon]|nr:DUF4128 domain-containing protein [Candidatus Pacearchaeota archaeon]